MRRVAIAILSLLLMASVTLAANPHFVVGPTFTVNPNTGAVTASGKIAGLGKSQTVNIEIEARAALTVDCINPAGKRVPGQSGLQTTLTGSGVFTADKAGNLVFSVSARAPLPPTAREAGCPNNQWTVKITNVQLIRATLTLKQGVKEILRTTYP